MRALRSDQAEQEGTDFVTVLNASQKKYFPASDLHDWTARCNTSKRLAEDMVKEFRRRRLQSLESENARLKGQASRSTRADPNPTPLGVKERPRYVLHLHLPCRTLLKMMGRKRPILGHRHRSRRTCWNRPTERTIRTQDPSLLRTPMKSTFRSLTVFFS